MDCGDREEKGHGYVREPACRDPPDERDRTDDRRDRQRRRESRTPTAHRRIAEPEQGSERGGPDHADESIVRRPEPRVHPRLQQRDVKRVVEERARSCWVRVDRLGHATIEEDGPSLHAPDRPAVPDRERPAEGQQRDERDLCADDDEQRAGNRPDRAQPGTVGQGRGTTSPSRLPSDHARDDRQRQ